MEALEAILSRRTVPPALMAEPGPDDAALAQLLAAAAAAPDHGRLKPWRFLVVRGEARARLGELVAAALAREHPELDAAELDKQRRAPTRAPVLVIAIARLDPGHPKIPEIEQIAAAAAAVQNLLLAAHAMGFAGKWATGRPAYSPGVAAGLGLAANERILGLLYLGSPKAAPAPVERAMPSDRVAVWRGTPP
ncbi:MAG: nitroreductase [Geminicoccaceae bacterium]|nr:nitroreductase [Geminicoccaceae bacterium]MDW8369539.1 nitroreductase [Geminicoccaceae bacterium]